MSAALWTSYHNGVQEVWAEPDPERHIVSIPQTTFPAEMFLDGKPVWAKTAAAGNCAIVQAGRRPRAIHDGPYSVLHLYVPVSLLSDALAWEMLPSSAGEAELVDPECRSDLVIERIGHEVVSEMREGQFLSHLRVDALGQNLAIQLLRRWSNVSGATTGRGAQTRGGLAPWQERRAAEYLRDHLAEDVGLGQLASLAQLSPFHFARSFKLSTGLPPHAYLRRLRCEKAKELLTITTLSVGEIAAAVGYDTPQAFARMFRADVGVSPSEYRRERSC
jgi:AraC-like DNA-binding protein